MADPLPVANAASARQEDGPFPRCARSGGAGKPSLMDVPARLKRSVRNLLNLEFDILLCGDGASILHDADKRLKELVDTFPSE